MPDGSHQMYLISRSLDYTSHVPQLEMLYGTKKHNLASLGPLTIHNENKPKPMANGYRKQLASSFHQSLISFSLWTTSLVVPPAALRCLANVAAPD
jgi:hypothetical protein